jgi:hypothetical protein
MGKCGRRIRMILGDPTHIGQNFFGKLKEFKRIAKRADKTD